MRADIIKVWVDDVNVNIQTSDGQVKSEKIADYYRLCNATPEERQAFEYDNMGIHWSELDEDLSYEGFFQAKEEVKKLRIIYFFQVFSGNQCV